VVNNVNCNTNKWSKHELGKTEAIASEINQIVNPPIGKKIRCGWIEKLSLKRKLFQNKPIRWVDKQNIITFTFLTEICTWESVCVVPSNVIGIISYIENGSFLMT